MSNVLVTGSSGFIGRQLAMELSKLNYRVSEIDEEYFHEADWQAALQAVLDDVNPEVIFHVGACSNTLEQDVQYMMIRNYESTKVLSNWAQTRKRKLIYSSSAANYGDSGKYPSNLYGWSKYVAEDYVTKSEGVALRYFNVYGPGESNKGRMASFIYQAFTKSMSGERIELFPGTPLRDFIYIADVISANIYAFENFDEIKGNYYEVSTGVARSFEEKLNYFGFNFGYTSESVIPKGYQFYTCGNPKKWMNGWKPDFTLEKGLEDYKMHLEKDLYN